MPAVYEKLGIHFLYPDNWTRDEAEAAVGPGAVAVYSPGGAFWSVLMHPPQADPTDLVATALNAMRQVYDEVDAHPFHETVAGQEMVGCEMNFYCLDLTSTAAVRSFRTRKGTCVVFCQADDREYEQTETVFRAITVSLLRGLGRLPSVVSSTKESSLDC